MQQPFEIIRLDDRVVCTNGTRSVTVMDRHANVFRRRAIRLDGEGESSRSEALVVDIDGLRVYVTADDVIVSRDDLHL